MAILPRRRVCAYLSVGILCVTILSFWKDAILFKHTGAKYARLYHGRAFLGLHNPVPHSTEKVEAGTSHRQKKEIQAKSVQNVTTTATPVRFSRTQDRRKNSSSTHGASRLTPEAIVANKPDRTRTVRPSNCTNCFQTNFTMLIDQPELCSVKGPKAIDIVFFIVTTHSNIARRNAIRKTWASVTKNNTSTLRHVFILGTTADTNVMRAAEKEARQFGDVVIIGFRDTYRNLTLKVMSSLRWLISRCQNARFFMKTDDDVWINTRAITALVDKHSQFLQRGVTGQCSHTVRPRREKSKWSVPRDIYPEDRYPPYCQGSGYVSSLQVAKRVVEVSPDIPFFFLEDVYIGMCLQRLGFQAKVFDRFRFGPNKNPCQGQSPDVPSIHQALPKKMLQFWKAKCPS
ncbi:beta-1,3-galactosyltransferase 5-like [Babylonia areolata]|uniref:beta-1,3-galactosyltransferase 5-like n=1 Tax=Babylonia areolata TaxID=304850 RepID=UPI003FD47F5B